MKPPPPMPATNGSVTPSTAFAATAASIALPPSRRIWIPARVASGSTLATAPPVPTATASFVEGGAAPARTPPATSTVARAASATRIEAGRRSLTPHVFAAGRESKREAARLVSGGRPLRFRRAREHLARDDVEGRAPRGFVLGTPAVACDGGQRRDQRRADDRIMLRHCAVCD